MLEVKKEFEVLQRTKKLYQFIFGNIQGNTTIKFNMI